MQPAEIVYDDPTHTYTLHGEVLPSVSTVLGMFCDFDRVPRSVLEYKRKIGRAAHKAIELYEDGTLDVDTVDDAVMPYLESFIKFKAVKPLRVVASEQIIYSKKHRYAGRLDLNVEFLGSKDLWQLDVKCVHQMAPETALQTAAYAEASNEMGFPKITKRAGLQLQPDGSIAKLYPYLNHSDFLIFCNALNLYRWITNQRKK